MHPRRAEFQALFAPVGGVRSDGSDRHQIWVCEVRRHDLPPLVVLAGTGSLNQFRSGAMATARVTFAENACDSTVTTSQQFRAVGTPQQRIHVMHGGGQRLRHDADEPVCRRYGSCGQRAKAACQSNPAAAHRSRRFRRTPCPLACRSTLQCDRFPSRDSPSRRNSPSRRREWTRTRRTRSGLRPFVPSSCPFHAP